MRSATITDLHSHGFSSNHCPVTRQVMPNMTRNFKGFHISYARHLSHYGCDTTALVLKDRVFFILNGYHADVMVEAAEQNGVLGCVNVFIENINLANRLSEHLMAVAAVADPFGLYQTTLELIGQRNIDRMKRKCL